MLRRDNSEYENMVAGVITQIFAIQYVRFYVNLRTFGRGVDLSMFKHSLFLQKKFR